MAFVRHIKRGGSTYAYLVESYRENGKVKQRTLEYLGKVTNIEGKEIIVPPRHRRSIKSIRKRGVDLLKPLFADLRQDVIQSFGKIRGKKLFHLALVQFLSPSPLKYVQGNAEQLGIDDCNLSQSSLSKLLKNIDEGEIHRFFQVLKRDNKTIAFDITSLSSYGENLNSAEYGYNRDHLHIPQVNLCLAITMDRTPSYFRLVKGSIPDVSTIQHTVDELKSLGYEDIHLVLDRGFYSANNINSLRAFRFTSALPKRLNLFKDLVRRNLDIEHVGNFVSFKGQNIMVREIILDDIKYVLVHNPKIKHEQQQNFMEKLAEIERKVAVASKELSEDEIRAMMGNNVRYYDIKGTTLIRKKKAIQRVVNLMGKYILFTNKIDSPWNDILDLYRSKDVAEKAFNVLKNSGFLTPIRVWSDEGLLGKVLASFVFYYIYSRVMENTDFSYRETRQLFDSMCSVEYGNENSSDVELTKIQKKLLTQLGIKV